MPPGATGATLFTGLAVAVALAVFTPLRALPERERRRRRRSAQALLAELARLTIDGPPVTHWELAMATQRKPAQVLRALATLRRAGLIEHDAGRVFPTRAGRAAAQELPQPLPDEAAYPRATAASIRQERT